MPNQKPWGPPYLGAAYYPEDWPMEKMDEHIALMKEAGINVMRVGEFAWSSMEPREGEYDLGWLHTVIDKLAMAEIAAIMCTPTCTPPAWLTQRYPEVLFVDHHGVAQSHGARRHACPNNPVYREHCTRIVTRLAEEFGSEESIIGWQIDNEVYTNLSRSCFCPVCVGKFREFMRERYGTIENLNEAWCNSLWSMTYDSFDQLPIARPDVWHHPALLMAWDEFMSRSYIDFTKHQAEVLHKLTKHPIGTDMMMVGGVDHYEINRHLDIVEFNHYHNRDSFWESAFWFDLNRPIKDIPFWNTETATSWNGSVSAHSYNEPGFCRANSWFPIALGAEANMFWLWQTHRAGQELMHGAVIDASGRPLHIFGEVQQTAREFKAAAGFINGTRPVRTGLAIHWSNLAYIVFKNQPMAAVNYYAEMSRNIYKPLIQAQFRPDVIDASVDLAPYKLIFSPLLPALDQHALRERLDAWITSGGTWIAGPLTDVRTTDGARFTHAPYGCLEDWAGIYCKHQIPGEVPTFKMNWEDGTQSQGSLWYDGLELRGAEALATYADGPLAGLAAVTRSALGRGQIITLGTLPRPAELLNLLKTIGADVGILPVAEASENVMFAPREGDAGAGAVVLEYECRPGTITLPREATDILIGEKRSGTVEVPAYGVMVLKY